EEKAESRHPRSPLWPSGGHVGHPGDRQPAQPSCRRGLRPIPRGDVQTEKNRHMGPYGGRSVFIPQRIWGPWGMGAWWLRATLNWRTKSVCCGSMGGRNATSARSPELTAGLTRSRQPFYGPNSPTWTKITIPGDKPQELTVRSSQPAG